MPEISLAESSRAPWKLSWKWSRPAADEFVEAFFVERQAGCDQVDVETGGARGLDECCEIGAGERFAAGEVELHDAERRRLRGKRGTRFR